MPYTPIYPHARILSPRQHFNWRRIVIVAAIMSVYCSNVHSMPQAAEVESRLRARMSGYWNNMLNNSFDAAAQYVLPEDRSQFAHRIQKSRIYEWKIDKLTFNEDFTSCDTITIVKKPIPYQGAVLNFPLRNQWVLVDGEWYFKLPWEENVNPMAKMIEDMRAAQEARSKARSKPPPPPSTRPVDRKSRFESVRPRRLKPDTSNPTSIRYGERWTFRYTYENRTSSPIKIVSAHSDCHCTNVQKEHPVVAPGETGTLEVVLDSFGLPLGRIDRKVYVQFSDREAPATISLDVQNLPNYILSPLEVDFGTLAAGTVAENEVKILNDSRETVKILSNVYTGPNLEFSLDKTVLDPGDAAIVSLSYKALAPGGIVGNLQFITDLKAEPLITIPIRGEVVSPVPR